MRSLESPQQVLRAASEPIISVETKNKALIGHCKNAGQAWKQEAAAVNVHDVLSEALGRGVPYGIYEVQPDNGVLYVAHSADPAECAVEAIKRWWHEHGQQTSPTATKLLILADAGGSHGCRPRLGKAQLQRPLSDALGRTITVCHDPTGGSKWKPSEPRVRRFRSLTWAGQP